MPLQNGLERHYLPQLEQGVQPSRNRQKDLDLTGPDLPFAGLKKHTILFLLSDFLDRNYEKPLLALCKKHEVVGIHTFDILERSLPESAVLDCFDPESGDRLTLDGYNPYTRREYERMFEWVRNNVRNSFARAGADSDYYVLSGCFGGLFVSRGVYGSFPSFSFAAAGGRGFPGDAGCGFCRKGFYPAGIPGGC
jgi:hypothetical protein